MTAQPSDRELVAAAQAGDRGALDTLLRRHYDRIHAVCSQIAGSTRDGDDAALDAMISIVKGLGRFDGRSTFSTWSRNTIMAVYRGTCWLSAFVTSIPPILPYAGR